MDAGPRLFHHLLNNKTKLPQLAGNNFPNDFTIYRMVGMTNAIANVSDALPRNLWMCLLKGFRNMAGRLADDFQATLNA